MSKEAMKLALEAIYSEKVQKAAVILEEALAQSRSYVKQSTKCVEQSVSVGEPVAWRVKVDVKLSDGEVSTTYQLRNTKLSDFDEPLYTTPQQGNVRISSEMAELYGIAPQPKQEQNVSVGEPVAIIEELIPNTDSELLAVRWLSVEASFKNPVGTLLVPFKNIKEN